MPLVLNSDNVVNYLVKQQICSDDKQLDHTVLPKEFKNFNLIVNFANDANYLVKQERFDDRGEGTGYLRYEWILKQFFDRFPSLQSLQSYVSEPIYFDAENAIVVHNYLPNHISIFDFYSSDRSYPQEIAATIGAKLGRIHSLTFGKLEYQEYLSEHIGSRGSGEPSNLLRGLEKINPEIFGNICSEGLEFFKLYQRFPSLHQAVASLYDSYRASCLIHNDIKFTNYIIPQENTLENCDRLKLIDWEFFRWGDPALDLGTLVAQYLQLWLGSVYIDRDTDLNVSLSLASCPLEKIQPSLKVVIQNYLANFPQILSFDPDYLNKVVRFAGLSSIKHLQHNIEKHLPFNNSSICTLQVAKSLLCHPEQSMSTIFGEALAR